jgi:uncharacterized protein
MRDLCDTEIDELQELLDAAAAAAPAAASEALDVSALDGFLCGVLLQPQRVPEAAWLPFVLDAEGRAPAVAGGTPSAPPWLPLVRRRYQVLDAAISNRRWFDPWIFEVPAGATSGLAAARTSGPDAEAAALHDSVLPWVAGFALATERFAGLMQLEAQALAGPLALLYLHFDADDLQGLDDEPALAAALAATEPPADLAQAAEDLVRAVLLLADVSRPRPSAPRRPALAARTTPGRGPRGRPRRWRNARRAGARRGRTLRRCVRPVAPGRWTRR